MHPESLTGQASLVTPSRKRYFIMVLLFITVVINYLDRSNLSIAAPALTSELGIDPVHVGLIFSAFGWTYAAMQIPGGWLVDRVPPRILYTVALLLWSIATVMLGFAASFIALVTGNVVAQVQPSHTVGGGTGQRDGPRNAAHQPQGQKGT